MEEVEDEAIVMGERLGRATGGGQVKKVRCVNFCAV